MPNFTIADGNTTTFTDTTPNTGMIIDFTVLDNSFNVQVNGVQLFVGGPFGSQNELQFQQNATQGQTVRFASDGARYEFGLPAIWQINNSGDPIVRLEIFPDGTINLLGIRGPGQPLEALELFNGMTVNTAAIAAAWNDGGPNTIVVDQQVVGITNATGETSDAPCFAAGTLIETADGPVAVENLKVSDQVLTYENGYQPIRWIGSRRISQEGLAARPNLKPILIGADALGPGYPAQDLTVSPQHRVLVSSPVAQRMFGCTDVLVPANKLLPLDGIDTIADSPEGVEYWHILFDAHQVIWSNGSPTESLFTGPEALKAVSPASRAEIEYLFPEICQEGFQAKSACHIPETGQQMKRLVARHQANNKSLYTGA